MLRPWYQSMNQVPFRRQKLTVPSIEYQLPATNYIYKHVYNKLYIYRQACTTYVYTYILYVCAYLILNLSLSLYRSILIDNDRHVISSFLDTTILLSLAV